LVIKNGHLFVAIEAKSQVGPSFGNNFNNRTEEAMGSALDLWTAFREGAFSKNGLNGVYKQPAKDLSFSIFAKSLVSHIGAFS